MQTIKTAIVVVLLLFVLYGGYVAMNGTDTPLKAGLDDLISADQSMPDVSGPGPIGASTTGNSSNGFEMFNSAPSKGFASTPPESVASPFGSSNGLGASGPINSFPVSTNPPLQPAPLLTPASGTTATSTTFPPFPNTPKPAISNTPSPNSSQVNIPSLNSNQAFPQSSSEPSLPILTNNPGFSANVVESKQPGLPSSVSDPSIKPLELPNESGSALNSLTKESSPPSIASSASKSYENAKDLAMEQIERRNLKDALATLSVFYNAPEITTDQRQDLLDLLDALSREVVFSRSHLLDMAYVVAPGETLEQVAKLYDLPTEILARINAIDSTAPLRSGEKLKVVPGPFRAEVDLAKNELTVFLGDLYAGRYPVTFGAEPSPKPGVFEVVDKQKNRNYYGNGVQILATDPRNPFGGYWIDLGQDLCIHGSSITGPTDSKLGCISLSPMDANDVFGMLGRGSQVTVRR